MTIDWTQLTPTHHPGPRYNFGMAYDPGLDTTVLFGGESTEDPTTAYKETWEWNGTDWTEKFPTHFANNFAFGPDIANDKIILFEPLAQETWVFDGSAWTNAMPSTTPPAGTSLSGPCMMWDYANDQLVMFCTDVISFAMGDPFTYVWDGTDWTNMAPADSPSSRSFASITWSENLNSIVLFGGLSPDVTTVYNDAWVWDGTNWTELTTVSHPDARFTYDMLAFDPGTRSVVLFGGHGLGTADFSDTWILFEDAPGIDTGTGSGACAVATLEGQITSAFDGTWWYEYGPTMSYGTMSTGGSFSAGITDVSEDLSGLTPSTTYHFRLAVTTVEGTFYGDDATWDEGACPPATVNCEFGV